jgi:ribosomal-protein-alanine N-acetyltransferase
MPVLPDHPAAPMTFLRTLSVGDEVQMVAGGDVFLRSPRPQDFEAWSDLRARSRDFLKPWEPLWPADDLGRGAYRRRLRRYGEERRADQSYSFFLFRTDGERLLGGLTLSGVRRGVAQCATLGYWMGEPHAGRGYMTAGVRLVLPHAFGTLKLRRIEASCLPHNARSVALLEKIGFQREGYAREYLCIDGIWQDHLLYAILKTDQACASNEQVAAARVDG